LVVRNLKFAALCAAFALVASTGWLRAAPDHTLGMALMGGLISPTGQFQAGSGITNVQQTGTGEYVITFERNIVGCPFATGTIGGFGVSTAIVGQGQTTLSVWTRLTSDNSAVDDSFSIVVFCPK
jgi:hypothetical protein